MGDWINTLKYIPALEYYSALNKSELLLHSTTGVNLKFILLFKHLDGFLTAPPVAMASREKQLLHQSPRNPPGRGNTQTEVEPSTATPAPKYTRGRGFGPRTLSPGNRFSQALCPAASFPPRFQLRWRLCGRPPLTSWAEGPTRQRLCRLPAWGVI